MYNQTGLYGAGHSGSSFSYTVNRVRPVQYKSISVAASRTNSLNWGSSEAVNFMDHLYFITNLVLDYLLENELPQELMNQTLLNDPVPVLVEHRNELITHFHKLLIAACTCLCIGISIPLFGFMIACCWCSSGKDKSSAKNRSTSASHSRSAGGRSTSRSRSHNREPSDADWLALSARDPAHHHEQRSANHARGAGGGSRHHRELERRRRHTRNHRRTGSGSASGAISSNLSHRPRSVPPSLRYESACHPCLRKFFSSNLFMVLLLVSFFAVCAFVTNEYVNNGVKQLPKAMNQSVDELQTYLNTTDHEVDNLFRYNYLQLENEINSRLDTSGTIIRHKIAVASEAVALLNLTDIVSEFNDTKIRLERLDKELILLKSRLNTAKKGLGGFRENIERCPPEECTLLRRKYQNLNNFRILPQLEKLPDVKNIIKRISLLMDSGIVNEVQKGKDNFEKFATFIQREIDGKAPEVKVVLMNVGKRLSNLANDVSQSIRWSDSFFNQTRTNTRRLNQYTEYEQYRHYACLAGAGVILFILTCYTLGWLFGSCRSQPTARTYKTKVKTSATATFPFSCGIFTVFLLFLPMILAAIVLFMTGSIGDKVVCRVIKHPEQRQSKQIYAMLQNKFLGGNLSVASPEEDKVTIERDSDGKEYKVYRPNYADLIARCHQNQSIYKVLKLDTYDKVYLADDGQGHKISIGLDKSFNLNTTPDFKKMNNIEEKLKTLIKLIDIDFSRITLLSPKAEEILRNSMSLSFDDIENSFNRLLENGLSISQVDIEQLIKDFQAQKASVTSTDVESELNIAIILASSMDDQLLPNITTSLMNLKEGVRHLKLKMFHGKTSFGAVISELIARVRSAETQLHTNGKTLMKITANEFVDEINTLIEQYANHVKNQVENVIGQCEPVSRALNATTSTLCDDIILPFNGYWLSIVASLILVLPATFLAYALKGLYRLARRGPYSHHNFSYTDHEDEISYEDDSEEVALAYHLGHHSHLNNKPTSSTAAPSAPMAGEDGWSPTSSSYVHNSRPPPYAV